MNLLVLSKEATKQIVEILDAGYKRTYLPEVITVTCRHLSHTEQSQLLLILESYEELFDGILEDF